MDTYFAKMDEHYRDKHYPKGSVLEKASKEHKRGAVRAIVMLSIFAAGFGAAFFWALSLAQSFAAPEDADMRQVGYVILAIVGVLFLLCVLGIVFFAKRFRRGVDTIIKKSEELSGLTEEDIREFDRQAMQTDSVILKFQNKFDAAFSTQKEGILTRDYLWAGDMACTIVKREDIVGVCFYRWHYYAGKKKMWSRSVSVLSRLNKTVSAEATEESGLALMELLAETHPDIHVEKRTLDEGKEYDNWRNALCSKA